MLRVGQSYTSHEVVGKELTAKAIGSGDLEVYATPAMVALMENAAMRCVAEGLERGQTTVGGVVEVSHLRPTPVGAEVHAKAVLVAIDGAKMSFEIEAWDEQGQIGRGKHTRFAVDAERFMAKTKASR